MLIDIKDEPQIIKKLAGLHLPKNSSVANLNLKDKEISKIYIVASGSSRNAGTITKYFIESVAQIPVIVEHASEFGERKPVLNSKDMVIFVSQSGETSDVLTALNYAKSKAAYTFAITNNEESTIHRTADSAMFIHAGKEISVPATKSFAAQLVCLYILGVAIAETNNSISFDKAEFFKEKIRQMPDKLEKLINNQEEIEIIAQELYESKSLILLGRGQNFGLAEEASLKIKETCYMNTGGYPTGEFLHGHLAMLDETSPIISVVTKYGFDENNYFLAISNTKQFIKKRDAKVVILKDSADELVTEKFSDYAVSFLNISEFDEVFSPVYSALVIHLLAFKMAELLGHDVNNPRSLSKTVLGE
jgi:glucosamine--fructose-6-phosphate aminotransferase (isomerizing)